ncbi:DUF1302 domain-containing protein [Denitrificimonas caeni]|uniref:DUF1302 domain-containing protein n=1 Tax=Denitrificimonas caeni TaxID=521720 RepID=UPI0003B66493|nr:DUF1302 domain-containing protein [Denitrificimonas caeni]
MTTKNQQIWRMAKLPLAVSLASVLATPAFAINFNLGEVEGSFDSSLSVGASWSTAKRDMDFIGNANGGTGYTQTGDDGRLNFQRGKTFSQIFKGLHDLELKYKDTGVFLRGKYWYDAELQDGNRSWKDISNNGRKEGAKTRGIELLDAFVYHNYAIADQPGTVRLGKQVVSWGESTFILNGINSINPVDVSAFRRPGAELKEGLIPVNMFFVSQNLTDQLSMEAFYQLSWKQTVVDNCGTFFSGADVAADGCNNNYNILSAKQRDDIIAAGALIDYLNTLTSGYYPELSELGINVGREGIMVPRGKDNKAGDSGQWGMALRWLGDNTEYGAYFMNYHSRTPFASYQNLDLDTLQNLAGLAALPSPGPSLPPGVALAGGLLAPALLSNGSYYMDYPEDIRLYGLSFSTTLPTGTAWQGEVSYRPNMPVQINATDMTGKLAEGIGASLGGAIAAGGSATVPGRELLGAAFAQAGMGHRGYNRKEVTQIQTTFTHFFDQVLGASRATVVGEVGLTHVGGIESKDDIRYGRDVIYGNKDVGGRHGYVTSNSWGYRVRGILDYNDVFAGVNLNPNMAFSHDVDGYGPNGQFNEGAKAISFGLDADYQNTYTASLSYTNFFDGRYNTLTDRDFVSMSVGVNF